MMLSATDSRRNTEGSCGRYPKPSCARRCMGKRLMSRLSKKISPCSQRVSPTIM